MIFSFMTWKLKQNTVENIFKFKRKFSNLYFLYISNISKPFCNVLGFSHFFNHRGFIPLGARLGASGCSARLGVSELAQLSGATLLRLCLAWPGVELDLVGLGRKLGSESAYVRFKGLYMVESPTSFRPSLLERTKVFCISSRLVSQFAYDSVRPTKGFESRPNGSELNHLAVQSNHL